MQIRCPACQAVHDVPPEKAAIPGLRCRCRCGNVFPVAAAPPPELVLVPPSAPEPAAAVKPASVAAPQRAVQPPAAAAAPSAPRAAAPAPPALRPPAPAPAERPLPGPVWKRCLRHPSKPSTSVCRDCARGFCRECERRVQNVLVCPECEGLCAATADYLAVQQRAREREEPLFSELSVIASYPLVDVTAFVLLAVVTGVFGFMGRIAAYSGMFSAQAAGVLLSTGILTWYAFTAAARVSSGNRRSYMPEFGDVSDIANALRLAGGAMVITLGPLLLSLLLLGSDLAFLTGGPAAQPEPAPGVELTAPEVPAPEADLLEEEGAVPAAESTPLAPGAELDEAPGAGRLLLHVIVFGLAALWALIYAPVALTVAAVSRSLLQTLNPLLGVATIVRMGSTYWQAAAVYFVIVLVAGGLGFVLNLIPVAGHFARAFVDAYAYLMIGCLIGLAVDKRAKELDLE